MSISPTTQCPQCGVSVDNDKIDLPDRCHRDCPLTQAKLTAPQVLQGQVLRGEFTQVDLKNAKPAALDPILKAHANLIGFLCKLDVPKLHVNPTPEEFEDVREYAQSVIRVLDMWFKTLGDEVDSASTTRINLNLFSDIFHEAVDGWALAEIDKAASGLREEIDEIERDSVERAVRHGRSARSIIDVLRAERGL